MIFVLGVISSGCFAFMSEIINQVFFYLINIMQQTTNPLLFRITSWTVCQYSEWIFSNLTEQQVDEFIQLLLNKMTIQEPIVQLAATSGICSMIEQGEEKMVKYYDAVIHVLSQCFSYYNVFRNIHYIIIRKGINVHYFVVLVIFVLY
jgi:hypothetical protein